MTAKPDPLIHPITRLSICGLLAAGADWVEFAALRDAAEISDSVLSKQSRVLEDAGYVEVRKGAVGRRPRTWFRLTPQGRQAVQSHLAWLAQLEQAVSAGTREPTLRGLSVARARALTVLWNLSRFRGLACEIAPSVPEGPLCDPYQPAVPG